MKISNLVEQSGKLLKVDSYAYPEVPDQLACLVFHFSNTTCFVSIEEDTDEIKISESHKIEDLVLVSNNPIWMNYINRELVWVWILENNQGYSDGIRFEFKNVNVSAELFAIASRIKLYRIEIA